MKESSIDLSSLEKAKVPISWTISLLIGCATFTIAAFSAGAYFATGDAQAQALEARVSKLEKAIEKIPEMANGIARLEGAMGTLPKRSQRIPAMEE
jgi:hypothetical protein